MALQTRRLTEDDGVELIDDALQQRLRLRVRRAVVAYIADLLDVSRPDRGAGMLAFNSLLNYPANTVGSRLKSILTGIGEGQPWGDVEALLTDLVGRINLGQLHADVQATIDLITADASHQNSVNARLAGEAQARTQSMLLEAQQRASAISTAIGELQTTLVSAFQAGDDTVQSRVTTEVAASVDRDNALGVRVDSVTARLQPGGDIYVSLAAANNYAYTKAQADSAVAASANELTTTFRLADTVLNTRITSESTASSDRDTALSTRVDGVSARLNAGGDIAISLAAANSYAYTKAQTDSAVAASATALTAAFQLADGTLNARITSESTASSDRDTALSTRVDGVSARLNAGGDIAISLAAANSYAYTKAQTDSAVAASATALTAAFQLADGTLNARITSESTASSDRDTALSTRVDGVSARLNAGGDIRNALAEALSYAYTRADMDGAFSALANTLRSEYQGLGSSVTSLLSAVAGPAGLQSQVVFKTIATRADGRPVLGYVGVASTASNDGTGASEAIIQADRILFVPNSDPNASPAQMMVLGTVNGVSTLVVAAGRIGDLSINTLQMANQAITIPVSTYSADALPDYMVTPIVTTALVIQTATIMSSGAPIVVMAGFMGRFPQNSTQVVELHRNGVKISEFMVQTPNSPGSEMRIPITMPNFIDQPGPGLHTYTLWRPLGAAYVTTQRSMVLLETKK